MSDNVPPHQYWRQTENPEYQWDPWKDDWLDCCARRTSSQMKISWIPTVAPNSIYWDHQAAFLPIPDNPGTYPGTPSHLQSRSSSLVDNIHNDNLLQSQVITPQHGNQAWGTVADIGPLPIYNQTTQQPVQSVSRDDHFTFESGCRPLDPSASVERHDEHTAAPSDTRLKCEHPGCASKRRFTRKYELQRHMKKHAPPVAYPCPVIGCAYQGARSFYRSDKLKMHLRMSHAEEALCQCPVQGCPLAQLPLGLMYYHAQFHRGSGHQTIPVLSQYQKNRSKHVSRCPIGNSNECGKWIASTQMPTHLLSHSEEDRLKFRTDALQAGYDSITGQPICSICLVPFLDPEEFATHIHLRHLLEPGSEGAEHVSKFYSSLVEDRHTEGKFAWTHLWSYSCNSTRAEDLGCPVCGLVLISKAWSWRFVARSHQSNIRDHLMIHKEDVTEVIRHRRQILKHYPEFIQHSIFDDLRVTYIAPSTAESS